MKTFLALLFIAIGANAKLEHFGSTVTGPTPEPCAAKRKYLFTLCKQSLTNV